TSNHQAIAQLETIGCSMLDVGCWMSSFVSGFGSGVQWRSFASGKSFHEALGTSNIQHPTSNTQPPINGPIGNHWLFDIGCWVLDVFLRFMGSMREVFGEFFPRGRLGLGRAVSRILFRLLRSGENHLP